MKTFFHAVLLFSIAPLLIASEMEDNWPHWRGPLENGYAPKATPPTTWDENTNIKWKIDLPGEGSATPIIWDDRVFVVYAEKIESKTEPAIEQPQAEPQGRRGGFRGAPPDSEYKFVTRCLDRNTGKTIWEQTAVTVKPHEGHHQTGTFASGSPVTDGENLYVTFGSRGIYCYDFDGNKKWDHDFGDMQTRNSFGEGTSLVLHQDNLLVNWDHEGPSFIACLDKNSGDIRWKTDRDERSTWGTPFITEYNGVTQVIVNGSNKASSYDLANGEMIWQCGGQTDNPIPSPFRYKDNAIVMSGFRGAACYAIPLSAKGDVSGTETIAWTHNQDTPYVPGPLLYGDQIYFLKGNTTLLTSLNAETGKPVLEATRLPKNGNIYASPMGADGRVYIATREGDIFVLKHGGTLEVIAQNKLDDGFDASPVAVGKQLFLRGHENLYCIE